MRNRLLRTVILISISYSSGFAQIVNTQAFRELPPTFDTKRLMKSNSSLHAFIVTSNELDNLISFIRTRPQDYTLLKKLSHSSSLILQTTISNLRALYVQDTSISFVDFCEKPKIEAEQFTNGLEFNMVSLAHSKFASIQGDSIYISIKENNIDTTNIDFKGRYFATSETSKIISSHANAIGQLIAGGGNSVENTKGVAWHSYLGTSNFEYIWPDSDEYYRTGQIVVQNHSYGTGIENYYGAEAAAFDSSSVANPSLVHVFSAGNAGMEKSNSGKYANLVGTANLTGNYKMGKNNLVVGAIDSNYNIIQQSSRGPAYDGRVKPELVAYGPQGTSSSAAIVTGGIALLQHLYKQMNGGRLPSSSLIKAILINSAVDVGREGLDFESGYGSVDINEALRIVSNSTFVEDNLMPEDIMEYKIFVPPSVGKIRVTLSWLDPPGITQSSKALVNDLDLQVICDATSETWKPWVLNSHPVPDSLSLMAFRQVDTLNNIEQVSLSLPISGFYTIRILGSNLASEQQRYAFTWNLVPIDTLTWTYPTRGDQLQPDHLTRFHVSTDLDINSLKYEYSSDFGATWQSMTKLKWNSRRTFEWKIPDKISSLLLKASLNNLSFVSDTIDVSVSIACKIDFNCVDSFRLVWPNSNMENGYEILKMGRMYFEPFSQTKDTAAIIHPSLASEDYAIRRIKKFRYGARSKSVQYSNQDLQCFLLNFGAKLEADRGIFSLVLSTLYNVEMVILEKVKSNRISEVARFVPKQLSFDFGTDSLDEGLNLFRVRLVFKSGSTLTSASKPIVYSKNAVLIYPNPIRFGQTMKIFCKNFINSRLEIYTMQGNRIRDIPLKAANSVISLGYLTTGIYSVCISTKNHERSIYKVIIYK